MFLGLRILLIGIVIKVVTSNGENILLNKPAVANDYKEYITGSNDGDKTTGMWLRSKNVLYIVFDLQKIYNVEKIVLTSGRYRAKDPLTIYVGDEMKLCHLHNQIKDYRICKTNVIQNAEELKINCEGSGVQGRYIAFIKGDFLSVSEVDEFNFYEIEAYGKLIGEAPSEKKKVFKSKPVKPVSREMFPIANQIRKNIPEMPVSAFTKGFIKLNKNCEPIIWDSTWNLTFSLACHTPDNKARALFFGREWYFWYYMHDADKAEIRKTFIEWLTPNNKNPKYVNSKDFWSAKDVRAALGEGDILDYHTSNDHPDDVMLEIKKLLLDGKIALVFDHNVPDILNERATAQMHEIMDIFNVDFDNIFFTFSSGGTYGARDEDFTDEFLDIETRLERILEDHDYLLKFGQSILTLFDKMTPRLLEKANLTGITRKFIDKYVDYIRDICPCKDDPASDVTERAIISMFAMFAKSQSLANSKFKVPCIDLYPFDYKTTPKGEKVTLEVIGEFHESRHPTGYYLAAGETLNYKVTKAVGTWGMSVGCQTDVLTDKRPEWYRYPNIYTNNVPLSKEGTIFSPFGGVLWLVNNEDNSTITITLMNVVPTPFFNILDKNGVSDWDSKQRKNPGLWAQIAGEDMIICERSDKLRKFDGNYLKTLMESWDKVVRNNYVFSGHDWRKFKPSQTVLDIMTSVGYAHSGYPVSTWDDWFVNIFEQDYIKTKGSWGMCHELGHNQQPGTLWTMSTVTEATNNIFCLFNTDKVWKLPYYGSTLEQLGNDVEEVKKFLNNGAKYSDWVDSVFVELQIYVQMANHFGFGFFKKVFSFYADHPELEASSDEEKYDLFANITSTVAGQNLIPMFDFWSIPISDNMRSKLEYLPCFLPDDYFMKLSASREKYILEKYPKCHRKSTFFEDFDPTSLTEGHRPNFIKKIE